jgi:hypothetical protein
MGAGQSMIARFRNAILERVNKENLFDREDCPSDESETITTEEIESIIGTEAVELFVGYIDPCQGIYENYEHDPMLGEINEDYIGSWHASEFVSDAYNERFVFFSSGNYLFFPSQYECVYSSNENCMPSPFEDGLWGVEDEVMVFLEQGDINNIITRSTTKVVKSPEGETPYLHKINIDGLMFQLMSRQTNLWDPDTGELCDW